MSIVPEGSLRPTGAELRAFSFWERHGTNSTWDPFGFCSRKKGRVSMTQKANLTPVEDTVGSPGGREARLGEACAIGSRFDRSGERHSAGANR